MPANTIKSRTRVLHNIGNAGTATREEVEAWWATRRDLAPATRNNDLTNLRTFYKWARRWEYRNDDPTARLDAPHVPNGLPRPHVPRRPAQSPRRTGAGPTSGRLSGRLRRDARL